MWEGPRWRVARRWSFARTTVWDAGVAREGIGMNSGEGEQLGLELVFGDVGANDLILDLAIFEEQQKWDGAHAVFDGEFAGFIDIDLADFGLAIDFGGELIEDGTDHFAGTAPFRPEVDEDGDGGVDHFSLEIGVSKFQ